jgi:hypothetical protein
MNERTRQMRGWRVAVLPILIACVACGGRDEVQPDLTDDGPLAAYLQFAAGSEPDRGDAAYVADGLRLLAGALGDAGIGGPDLGVDLRVTAEHVLLNPASPDTATGVRSVLVSAADALGAGDTDDVQATAESIDSGRGIDEQVDTVQHFFRDAAAVLERRFQPR